MTDSLVAWVPALGSSPQQFVEAFGVLAGFTLVGFVIDTVLFRLVKARSESRAWKAGFALARGLHGFPTAIALLLGATQGLRRLDITERGARLLGTSAEVVGIALLTAFGARIAGRMIRAYTQRDDSRLPSSTIFVNLARVAIWVIGGVSILGAMGVSITPLIAALGVGGLAIGLALQPTLENVFAGIQVLMSRQVEPGDFIQLESGEQGWVEDVTWRNTTIKLFTNDLVIVPNATIAQSRIVNFTSTDTQHVISLELGVAYDSDLQHVERVTLEVATEMQGEPGAVPDYEPLFRYKAFGDSAVLLTISIRAETVADRWVLRHEFIKRLHARYAAEDIVIPFAQRTVHLAPGPAAPQSAE